MSIQRLLILIEMNSCDISKRIGYLAAFDPGLIEFTIIQWNRVGSFNTP